MAHKPNLNVMDKDGITPLIMAAKEGSYEIVSALVGAGAYINLQVSGPTLDNRPYLMRLTVNCQTYD